MSYDKYNKPKASTVSVGTRVRENPENVVARILKSAEEITDWNDIAATRSLKTEIMGAVALGTRGDKALLRLILHTKFKPDNWTESIWAKDTGRSLLCWMLRDTELKKVFVDKPAKGRMGEDELSGKLPIHYAIENGNFSFLAAFLGICYDFKFSQDQGPKYLQQPDRVLECTEDSSSKENCVHFAVKKLLPFTSFMAAVCSAKALTDRDGDGYTPLHRAMDKAMGGVPPIPLRPRTGTEREKAAKNSQTNNVKSRMPFWDSHFNPLHILEEIKLREDADRILQDILTSTNKEGRSPYLEDLDKWTDNDTDPGQESDFKRSFKSLIFQKVIGISNVSKALYGSSGNVKELCLDMSDFNQSSHNFEKFVEKLTSLDADTDEGLGMDDDDSTLQFEDTLFFVHLPDLNYVKQPCPHKTLRTLFLWLKNKKHVKIIKKLNIPDNTINPMNPVFFKLNILDNFEVEALDWRKLDMSLDVLTGGADRWDGQEYGPKKLPKASGTRNSLKELTLYSTGNWSVLYHWISKDGLARLPNVRIKCRPLQKFEFTDVSMCETQLLNVRIEIIHLNPADGVHEKDIHTRHLELAEEYMAYLENRHSENKKLYKNEPNTNFEYKLDIKVNAKWYYPPPPHEPEDATARVPLHQFTGQLGPCQKFLDEQMAKELRNTSYDSLGRDDQDEFSGRSSEATQDPQDEDTQHARRLQKYALPPARNIELPPPDSRIKVAIIDNGADRIRSSIGEMIAKGVSYVTADLFGSDQILPWWMVSDAHGTQMASLIGQTNPYCRLYIARVGKGRKDIDPKWAAKFYYGITDVFVSFGQAVKWALEQRVDIISMSWTTPKNDGDLEQAIKDAADDSSGRATLMFCSTADEGMFSETIYPVDYDKKVVSVSATDRWGHFTPKAMRAKEVDIRIPGENIEAVGPAYIGSVAPTVSGSSVATALAAGIASLALLLLRTYNKLEDREMRPFYTKQGIMRIFKKMDADKGGIQLSKLFPRETADEDSTRKILAENWNIANFPE